MSLLGLVVITGWVIILTISFNLLLANRLKSEADSALRTRATTAAATVAFKDGNAISVREGADDAVLDSGIWVYSKDGSVERPHGDASIQAAADRLAHGPSRYLNNGETDRLYSLPLIDHGKRAGTVVASVSLEPYRHATKAALAGSALVAGFVLLGAYPVLRIAAGRALRPVDEMTKQAADWSAHEVSARFGDEQRFREIQTLAATLDGVLDRLSAVVRHERQLSAELSHELRTPLARIVAEVDLLLARHHDPAELETAHRAMRESALSMERILETLLAAARADIRDAPGRCELAPAVAAAVASLGPETRVQLHTAVGPGAVGVDAAIVERVLAPVLDNALRYAATGVRVTSRNEADTVVLCVDDDGPGVPVEEREAIFEPGFRGQPDDAHDGAGLGLALARRLARAATGDVVVSGPESTFEIRLPPA
ncbi:MAG: Histidine kinase [Jatrophihabitans sp.]|nr:Histidine kinase [Jatrophihabitans sp.]